VPEATVVAQKILSCVARLRERFGIAHVVAVLRGQNTERIRKFGHEQLSTYGLLGAESAHDMRDWVYQLLGQKVLAQEEIPLASGEKAAILKLNAASWEVMRGERKVRLVRLVRRKKGEQPEKSRADTASWEGVDRELFEKLRVLRREVAEQRQWQPYLVFSDATLRELARVRPSTREKMRLVYGIGEAKLRDFGERFLQKILEHCRRYNLALDQIGKPAAAEARAAPLRGLTPPAPRPSPRHTIAFELFRQGAAVEDVMHQMGRARSTVLDYLCEFIRAERPASVAAWIQPDVYQRVAAAARQVGTERLKPIFIALGEQVPYDEIRVVVAHLTALADSSSNRS
jgi:ATP-dependent DNA helicase RecQ